MANKSKTHIATKQSKLDAFTLSYELDIPWDQANKTVQHRPTKK